MELKTEHECQFDDWVMKSTQLEHINNKNGAVMMERLS